MLKRVETSSFLSRPRGLLLSSLNALPGWSVFSLTLALATLFLIYPQCLSMMDEPKYVQLARDGLFQSLRSQWIELIEGFGRYNLLSVFWSTAWAKLDSPLLFRWFRITEIAAGVLLLRQFLSSLTAQKHEKWVEFTALSGFACLAHILIQPVFTLSMAELEGTLLLTWAAALVVARNAYFPPLIGVVLLLFKESFAPSIGVILSAQLLLALAEQPRPSRKHALAAVAGLFFIAGFSAYVLTHRGAYSSRYQVKEAGYLLSGLKGWILHLLNERRTHLVYFGATGIVGASFLTVTRSWRSLASPTLRPALLFSLLLLGAGAAQLFTVLGWTRDFGSYYYTSANALFALAWLVFWLIAPIVNSDKRTLRPWLIAVMGIGLAFSVAIFRKYLHQARASSELRQLLEEAVLARQVNPHLQIYFAGYSPETAHNLNKNTEILLLAKPPKPILFLEDPSAIPETQDTVWLIHERGRMQNSERDRWAQRSSGPILSYALYERLILPAKTSPGGH